MTARMSIPTMLEFARQLPKAELHAHLHGSIRPATLSELVLARDDLRSSTEAQAVIADVLPSASRSLHDCFRIFDLIHRVVTDAATVRRIAAEVVDDFAADNVRYLELRTTPRALASTSHAGLAKIAEALPTGVDPAHLPYVAAILEAAAEGEARHAGRIVVRYLLSINRTGSVEAAQSAIALAKWLRARRVWLEPAARGDGGSAAAGAAASTPAPGASASGARADFSREACPACGASAFLPAAAPVAPAAACAECTRCWRGPYVVGVDLSGDPTRGDVVTKFVPLLRAARADGLKLSLHCAEVMNVRETLALLSVGPDRLGHMCVLTPAITRTLLAMLKDDVASANDDDASAGGGGAEGGAAAGGAAATSTDATAAASAASAAAAADAAADAAAGAPRRLRGIPIEVCPTSNKLTLHLPDHSDHPTVDAWLASGYPFCVCTDDSGVFSVSLSEELASVAAAHALSRASVAALARAAFDYAFAPPEVMAPLLAEVDATIDVALV